MSYAKPRRKSRLPVSIQEELLRNFVNGVPARTAAEVLDLNRNTVTLFYHKLREHIYEHLALDMVSIISEVKADESYFGGIRKGKRGRGAAGKIPVFGLLNHGGKVYTVMIADIKASTLLPSIRSHVRPDSVVYTDSLRSYDALDVTIFIMYGLIKARILLSDERISMALRTFGINVSVICAAITVSPNSTSSCS